MSPSSYTPTKPSEFIGAAAQVAALMGRKAERLRNSDNANLKVLFYGAPGVGKTALAWFTGRALSCHHLGIEHANGKEVTVETVRGWIGELNTGSLFTDWTVKIVDELDRCSRDAQDLLLTYLDRLPPCRAFIGTSNLQLDLLQERFQTRLQQFKIDNPTTSEVADLIAGFGACIPLPVCEQIAFGSGGNVRAALLDAESYLDAAPVAKKGGRK